MLSKRLHGAFIRDASLKPNVAAAMIMMSKMQEGISAPREATSSSVTRPPGMTLIDPFVGSGTIVLEAAIMFRSGRFIGVERSERVVQGARDNAQALGLEERVELLAGNARVLKELTGSGAADVIVTNPPWGVRLGKCDDIDELYRGFLQSAADVLRVGGRLVIIVLRWESFLQFARQSGRWMIERVVPVRTGDLVTVVFVMKRISDDLWADTKAKVKEMAAVLTEGDGSYTPPPPRTRVEPEAADAAAATASVDATVAGETNVAAAAPVGGKWGRKKGGDSKNQTGGGGRSGGGGGGGGGGGDGGGRGGRNRKDSGVPSEAGAGEDAGQEERRPRRVSQ